MAPGGDEYAAAFRKRVKEVPAYAVLSKQVDELAEKQRAYWKQAEPCYNQLKATVFEEADFYQDVDLKVPVAKARFFLGEIKLQILPSQTWAPFTGDFTPGGETGYFYQTVLEKRGDRLQLPKKPFPMPVWFDFKRTFGQSVTVGGERGISYLFPASGNASSFYFFSESSPAGKSKDLVVLPFAIQSEDAVFKLPKYPEKIESREEVDPALEADMIGQTAKSGKSKRVPLKDLFNEDGHLRLTPRIGC